MMSQMLKGTFSQITLERLNVGLTVFFIGLFKKVILADSLGVYSDKVFNAATEGTIVSFLNSWIATLSYTFQLYFDFSGYCDMAIGLAFIFGICLPLNFYSPYKATSAIDFWHRWHITLSRFIRDYLYIPLGGNRKGLSRQVENLIIVMLIVGLWHGAGITFILWGGLHGIYLSTNHIWRTLTKKLISKKYNWRNWNTALSTFVTFMAISVAWVFFRAANVSSALNILKGMIGLNGFALPVQCYEAFSPCVILLERLGFIVYPVIGFSSRAILWILISSVICFLLPNTQEYMENYKITLDSFPKKVVNPNPLLRWKPSLWRAIVIAFLAVVAILHLGQVSEFIYFQF
jgi:D-alanyl-lipoteichoic acid acyltransferase DltB (MBOAT superfamily)